ncbi:MAG: succinate dehydrogenase/fumarate reductase iron-sulfur subunit [Holophagales bacterium]|jgi:succinate dehydrogenase / fumarate reductase iron-sulfur subunit|nr:succinate dehydrogenase/fumarate reductase iron-sulfur subunit [Holophagales bacterium]
MSGDKDINIKVRIWRQKGPSDKGGLVTYDVPGVSTGSSFLEMLDLVSERLMEKGEEPVALDHDCREGICGACSLVINGVPHGPRAATTTCQLHMRTFHDGQTITVEPFRAKAFPVLKDLIVDRSAYDRIIAAGGFVSVNTGVGVDANTIAVRKENAELAMDAAACVGCGACAAACPNASAMLFVGAKVSHLGLLPQGQPERKERVLKMVAQMDAEGFGACTNMGECEAACPKEIKLEVIARMNRDYLGATLTKRPRGAEKGGGA